MHKRILSGILLTSFSYFLFSVQDASVKWLVAALPIWQVLFVRSVTIFAICAVYGRGPLLRRASVSPILKPMFVRNLLLLAAWLSYYTASRDLGLAELTTLYYASPIIVTVLAIPILGEAVPLNRWVAVLTGFLGVLIACDVFGKGMTISLPVYLALQAAVFWGIGTILLRKTALQETTLVQMTISSGFLILFTGLVAPFVWLPFALSDFALMIGTGVLAGIAQFALFEGMRRAEVSLLAPFEYSSLVWGFILGFLIWNEVPAHNVFIGAVLIFSAGMIIIAAERFARQPTETRT
ncbi:drug/metabolite transporter (DMT)-like permease [Mycoplana sp. BE70]|uniref:DMT family transporter n=1 Tax=Mycoplana sp. BE70 TaxID=2817775 RepID=UPI002863BF95|nr:DMT family transporter [Mycoplana sp. BE70]MDR6754935.1 drug/metabolite transporter (DMT)-like permease [Mycoplana sp. BE70]